jgi:hypothetical protein
MHLLTPAPRRWPDPRSSGVGLYTDDPHGLIHDPVASASGSFLLLYNQYRKDLSVRFEKSRVQIFPPPKPSHVRLEQEAKLTKEQRGLRVRGVTMRQRTTLAGEGITILGFASPNRQIRWQLPANLGKYHL